MKNCPTCQRRPSERIGTKRVSLGYLSIDREPETGIVPTMACPDPIHDRADAVDDLVADIDALYRKLVLVGGRASMPDLIADDIIALRTRTDVGCFAKERR